MNRVWTEVEREFVRKNAGNLTDEHGARKLGELVRRDITKEAWRKQRQKLGIKKKPGRGVCELESERTVPGLNGQVTYSPDAWSGEKPPNVMCYGKPAYVKPELWPEGSDHLTQEDVKRLMDRSMVS